MILVRVSAAMEGKLSWLGTMMAPCVNVCRAGTPTHQRLCQLCNFCFENMIWDIFFIFFSDDFGGNFFAWIWGSKFLDENLIPHAPPRIDWEPSLKIHFGCRVARARDLLSAQPTSSGLNIEIWWDRLSKFLLNICLVWAGGLHCSQARSRSCAALLMVTSVTSRAPQFWHWYILHIDT